MFKIFKKLYNEKRVILEKFTGERMSLAHVEYIKLLVKKAGEIDKTREVFGASKHQYKINPAVSIDNIYRFESKYNIKLTKEMWKIMMDKVEESDDAKYDDIMEQVWYMLG